MIEERGVTNLLHDLEERSSGVESGESNFKCLRIHETFLKDSFDNEEVRAEDIGWEEDGELREDVEAELAMKRVFSRRHVEDHPEQLIPRGFQIVQVGTQVRHGVAQLAKHFGVSFPLE